MPQVHFHTPEGSRALRWHHSGACLRLPESRPGTEDALSESGCIARVDDEGGGAWTWRPSLYPSM